MKLFLNMSTITASKRNQETIFDYIEPSLKELGHTTIKKLDCSDYDVAFVFGSYCKTKPMRDRNLAIHNCLSKTSKVLSLDIGVFHTYSNRSTKEFTIRFGQGSSTGQGNFFLKSQTNDRLNLIKERYNFDTTTNIDPTEANKMPILVAMQVTGFTFDGGTDVMKWTRNLLQDIRKITNRKVIVKTHPRQNLKQVQDKVVRGIPNVEIYHAYNNRTEFADIVKQAGCMITHSSSASFSSYIEGVPVICLSDRCINHQNYFRGLGKVNKLEDFRWDNREEILSSWVHTSWAFEEIKQDPSILENYLRAFNE
jgi:hypothetical protein